MCSEMGGGGGKENAIFFKFLKKKKISFNFLLHKSEKLLGYSDLPTPVSNSTGQV